MLVKLTPEQIAENWDLVKYSIEQAIRPNVKVTPEGMNRIFESLLLEKMACWALSEIDYEAQVSLIRGLLTTVIERDPFSQVKSLVVYSVYSIGDTSMEDWFNGMELIRNIASGEGCSQIIAYSREPSVIKFVERLGGDVENRVLIIPMFQN